MADLYTRKVAVRVKQPDGHWGGCTWALVGASPEDCEAIARTPERPLKTSVKAPRDQGRHRYLMKLFSVAHKALPESWPAMSYDTFRKALMIDAGFFDEAFAPHLTGDFVPASRRTKKIPIAWSLEFAAMDDTRHKEVVDGVIKCLCQKWIPGLSHEAFTNEILAAI